VEAAIREVGRLLGRAARAEALVAELAQTRARIRARAAKRRHPRALIAFGFDPLVVAGPASFAAELLEDAGGQNVAADGRGAYPVYSVEAVIAQRPDVILFSPAMSAGSEKLRRLKGLSGARWVALPSEDLLHPGPRLAQALEELFRVLHPDGAAKAAP
jgi:iron complex transport system substrate-binding protein